MRQVTRKPTGNKAPRKPRNCVKKKKHPQYGTSKLEERFANEFLDRLGVEYTYQFEAKDIGRFYDFYLPKENAIIEIDGDYWHGNPEKYSDDKLKWHQKKARRVDELKDKWALMHGITIIRIWESDIEKDPSGVMSVLRERIGDAKSRQTIVENRRKRHPRPKTSGDTVEKSE